MTSNPRSDVAPSLDEGHLDAHPETSHTMDSPAIQVTDDESEHPHTKGSNVQPQQQSSNNASRIQWDDSPAEATGATGGSHDSDQTALDPETLASLKQSAKGVTSANNPQAKAGREKHSVEDYFNFEGRESEMVIPEGETDGLPSARARRKMARHQQKPKSFGAKLKSMFIGKGEQATFADAEKQTESGDASTDVSTDDEDDITAHPGARSQPFSVLGNLLALRDADHSGNSTAASSTVSLNSSIDENEGKSKLKHPKTTTEKDVHEKILNPEDGTSANPSASPSPQPGDSGRHTPRSAKHSPNKSAGNEKSLFSLKGHPAFLDKPTKYLSSAAHSALSTPGEVVSTVTKNFKGESSAAKKRRKEKKKDAIKAKLAAVIERQSFIMKLTRALMMFGSPSHRLEALITNTGTFLDAPLQCVFTPGVMTISFIDPATRTSETKFIKQGTGLDLNRLPRAQKIYRHVMHGRITVKEASNQLDMLMLEAPQWNAWQTIIVGMFASAWITPLAFDGGFVDTLGAMMLGGLLVAVQMTISKVESYANIFEIFIAAINSFIASALASTGKFCFSAVASGSIVLILPGFIVLCGSLELTARNISAGSVRMFYAIIYSLLLGFGLSLGSQTWYLFTNDAVLGQDASSCSPADSDPWWMQPAPNVWKILFAPMFLAFLAMRNQATPGQKELYIMILIGCAGYTVNYFVSNNDRFGGQRADFSSALGCFAVGLLGNLYSRFTNGNGFAVMAPGVLFQLPSGLSASGGLLTFASTNTSSDSLQSVSQNIGQSLISIAIGITVGLFFSSALVNPSSANTRRQAAYFAF